MISGSARVKAARRMLMKLTPGLVFLAAETGGLPSHLLEIVTGSKGKPVAISQPIADASAGPGGAAKVEPSSTALVKKHFIYQCRIYSGTFLIYRAKMCFIGHLFTFILEPFFPRLP